MPDPKECFKAHPTLHSLTGLGLGLIIASFFSNFVASSGLVVGVILIVLAIAGEFVFLPKKGSSNPVKN